MGEDRFPSRREPLQNDHIRLLKFSDDSSEIISLVVDTFPLTQLPPYTALSYCWGEEPEDTWILLDRELHLIKPNLASCLIQLRDNMGFQGYFTSEALVRYFWIDALCIDQINISERNDQVLVMDEIYSRATEVTAWLGPVHPIKFDDLKSWEQNDMQLYCYVPLQPISERLATDDPSVRWCTEIQALASNAYWTRMWIVQEILLSRKARIVVGSHALDLRALCDAVKRRTARTTLASIYFSAILPFASAGTATKRPLHELLASFGKRECRDKRDLIFSLLSLTPPQERFHLAKFFPDYTLTDDAVFTITMSFLHRFNKVPIDRVQSLVLCGQEGRWEPEIDVMVCKAYDFDIMMKPDDWIQMQVGWEESLLSTLRMQREERSSKSNAWRVAMERLDSETL